MAGGVGGQQGARMSAASAPTPAIPAPIAMGVLAEIGETHPQLDSSSLEHIRPTPALVLDPNRPPVLGIDGSVDDPMDLTQTGWGVLFASDTDPAVREALQPLLDLRKSQVKDNQLFRIFEGNTGVHTGQTASSWAMSRAVTLSAPVSPKHGVPFYLLLVGSPQQITFEFQAELDLQWAAGRLYFDQVADYAAYAKNVVAYETAQQLTRERRTAVWMPRNPLDLSTPLLAGTIGPEFMGQNVGSEVLGEREKFKLSTFIGETATKATLTDIFRGKIDGGPASLFFTGSHGAEWPIADPVVQKERQGALVTQEWTRGQPLTPASYFCGADLPADADLQGTIAFTFACFGGGCPDKDSYFFDDHGANLPLTPQPIISRLPQTLLSRGMLAIIAHVDRAFSYAFEDILGTPQAQLLRTPLELLMKGKRVGLASDPLSQQWSSLAAELGIALGGGTSQAQPSTLTNLYIARDDARNYLVLGDPAVRLRTELMS
jgi:hypothetical protein